MGGMIRIRVEKEVDQSHLTQLWNQDRSYEKPADKLQKITDIAGKNFTWIVILIAMAGGVYRIIQGDMHLAAFVFTSVLIIACPCALALSVPFTFGNTMRIFGKKGLYIKNTEVIEKMAGINTIVFDKTGTITHAEDFQTLWKGRDLTEKEKSGIFSLARQSAHPMSMALVSHFRNSEYFPAEQFTEAEGRGVFGQVHGIAFRFGSADVVSPSGHESVHQASVVHLRIGEEYAGYFTISNRFREGLAEMMEPLRHDFDLYLLTGDHDAERLLLESWFPPDHLHFNQKPGDKASFIQQLQKEGKVIMMTGDGLNDAGALMQSDVALTIANKAYQFSPASDAVLEAGKFSLLDNFIRFTKTARGIVYLSFAISLTYNILGISIALTGKLSPVIAAILMPASSVTVVAFATFATRLAGQLKLK
jgi:Cu+-exporting ATPase